MNKDSTSYLYDLQLENFKKVVEKYHSYEYENQERVKHVVCVDYDYCSSGKIVVSSCLFPNIEIRFQILYEFYTCQSEFGFKIKIYSDSGDLQLVSKSGIESFKEMTDQIQDFFNQIYMCIKIEQ